MKEYQKALVTLVILVPAAIFLSIILSGGAEELFFDQIPYNYNSQVWIPPNTANGSSLGGYYNISGKGRDFNFHMILSGAEESESPLDYIASGLKGKGHVDEINVTYRTIFSLYSGDFKDAILGTRFKGNMNMSCAAWTGTSQFQNDGQNFLGTFVIIGTMTDWEGTYRLVEERGRIAMIGDYIYYPHGKKQQDTIKRVVKTFYL